MTTRDTPFADGTPCWVDLYTSDLDKAKAFYQGLFGWTFEGGGPEFGGYITAHSGGHPVVGVMANTGAEGSPDGWTTYISSSQIETHVAAATTAGAQVIAPTMEVGPLGSMAVLIDPANVAFGIWQPGSFFGFTAYNEPGSVSWNELHTTDFGVSTSFYPAVFGWELESLSDTDEFRYSTAKVDGQVVAGLSDDAAVESAPTHWAVYVNVADVDATLAKVVDLGGTVVRPAVDTPYGRLAEISDPTGVPLSLMQDLPA